MKQNNDIHPISSFVTIVMDWMWFGIEAGAIASVLGIAGLPLIIILAGVTCLIAVALIQYFVADDEIGPAIAKGFAMGVAVGVPFPVVGTGIGAATLGWSWYKQLKGD